MTEMFDNYQPGTRNPLEGIRERNPICWEAPDEGAALREESRLHDLAAVGGMLDRVHLHRDHRVLTITRVDR